jgi:hypothetical protein
MAGRHQDPYASSSGRVAAFSGHMTDAPGRMDPRFPEHKAEAVRMEIARRLAQFHVQFGFSSAARGADILFIEELLTRDGSPHVFLPFPRDAFAKTSVGYGWDERYQRILQDSRVRVVELSSEVPADVEQPAAYDRCNKTLQEEAIRWAADRRIKPMLVTVWNGNPGDGRGGTADAVKAWERKGYALELINLALL